MARSRVTKYARAARTNRSSHEQRALAQHLEEEYDDVESIENVDIQEGRTDIYSPKQESSQNAASDDNLRQLMVTLVDARRKSHKNRKRAVLEAYEASCMETRRAIGSFFDNHETSAFKAQAAQLARLQDLLQQKANIEGAMRDLLVQLRKDYLAQSQALQKVIEYHLKQLR